MIIELFKKNGCKLQFPDFWLPGRFLLYYELLAVFFWAPLPAGDVTLYSKYVTFFIEGSLPYRDFFPEYPPLAFAYYLIPALFAKTLFILPFDRVYLVIFGLLNCLVVVCFGLILFRLIHSTLGLQFAILHWRRYCVHISCLMPMVAWRFDIVVALLCLASLYYFLVEDKLVVSGVLIGLGVGFKLYPVLLIPVITLYLYFSRSRPYWFGLGLIGGLVSSFLPPLLYGGLPGLVRIYSYHAERGLQIESIPASLAMLIRKIYHEPMQFSSSYGSWNLDPSPAVEVILRLIPFFAFTSTALTLCVIYTCFACLHSGFKRIELSHLFLSIFLVLIAALLFSKVLSPQFMVWLIPFAGLASKRVFRLSVIAFLLTTALLVFLDVDLFADGWFGLIVLLTRNLLLICLFIDGLKELSKTYLESQKSLA